MAILNEFELKVVNKEIKDLNYEEVVKIFGDCLFISVTQELEKLADVVKAISYIPNELDREVAWESAKYTFKDVFAKATICVAPRFHICEMPVQVENIFSEEVNESNEEENSQEVEKEVESEVEVKVETTTEQQPIKRKGLKK